MGQLPGFWPEWFLPTVRDYPMWQILLEAVGIGLLAIGLARVARSLVAPHRHNGISRRIRYLVALVLILIAAMSAVALLEIRFSFLHLTRVLMTVAAGMAAYYLGARYERLMKALEDLRQAQMIVARARKEMEDANASHH